MNKHLKLFLKNMNKFILSHQYHFSTIQIQNCYLQMDNNEQKVTAFLQQIKQSYILPDCIRQFSKKYEINAPQLLKLSPEEIIRLRSIILTKKQSEPEFREKIENEWNQCEKKIFNWMIICYAQLNAKSIQELNDQELDYLSSITTQKSLALIKYHICTLMKHEGRPKWSELEDKILHQILAVEKKHKPQGEWIFVSKELFLRGDQKSYKSAKSCRQRWFNHIDPALTKEWTLEEDCTMLDLVKKEGKKWAFISNRLNHAKNQHMIKNRFYSLLKKQQKGYRKELEEDELIDIVAQRLKNQLTKNNQKIISQPKKIKTQVNEVAINVPNVKKQQPTNEMKLISSFHFHPICTKEHNDNHFTFLTNNQLDSSKLFKQENQQKDAKASQLLRLSQSYNYSIAYPSPIPVTPGYDLNIFNDNHTEPSFKNTFKFNLNDFLHKNNE